MGLKGGCITLLLIWIGVGLGNYFYLQGTTYDELWWIGPLLGLGAALTLANIMGIVIALRQARVLGRPVREWGDGEFVGISGKLDPLRGSLVAPLTGRPAVIYEYEIKRITGSGKNRSMRTVYQGMGMAPCAVKGIRLVGFPLLTNLPEEPGEDDQKVAEYLAKTTFSPLPSNPLKALKELSAVLADEDGDVRADFCDEREAIHKPSQEEREANFDEAVERGADAPDLDLVEDEEPDGEEDSAPLDPKVEAIMDRLYGQPLHMAERVVEPQAEVTLFGTFQRQKRQIEIGEGFSNLQHSFHLGAGSKVIMKNMLASGIAFLVFGAATVFGQLKVLGMV